VLDYDVIQSRGFRNVEAGGRAVGFELRLRNPNYRGISGSLVDGVEVTVDGETWPAEASRWTLQGRTLSLDELRSSSGVRWQLDEPAVVTVPRDGGLAAGVHDVSVVIRLRAPYIPIEVQPSLFPASRRLVLVPPAAPDSPFRYGVSLYSYTGDLNTVMTLEDAMADIADLGATGIELLGEGHVPGYPEPTSAWVDRWFELLETYGLTPSNYGSWVDTRMWADRDLTADQGTEQLARDLRLAKRLGFGFVRPKFGVVSPDLVPHPIWEETILRNLDLAAQLDVVICPEIHSPTPLRHKVTQGYVDLIERTGTQHFKLLVDTGIFQTEPVDDGHPGFVGKVRPPHLEPLRVPPSDLLDVIDHVAFFQTKFYEIDDDLVDLHIPWPEIVPVLQRTGWSGWLSSEYEGRREPGRGRDQVRRQHALLRRLEAGTAGAEGSAA
jgi:sugar phosphate isomerase/epimerase